MPVKHSLYRRVVIRLALVLAFAGTALVVSSWFYARVAADDAFDQVLVSGALQIAENTWLNNGALNVDLPLSAFYVVSHRDRVFYKVMDPSGRVIAGDPELPIAIEWSSLMRAPVLQSAQYKGESIRIALVARQMYDPGPKGWALVALAETEDGRRQLAGNLIIKLLVVLLVMGAITVASVMLAVRQALLPLKRVAQALRLRDPTSLEPLAIEAPVEVDAMIETINAFMSRLHERIVLMRRVIGDVAHQVRTPITAALGQVEVLEAEPSEAGRARQIERVRQNLTDVGMLTQQLVSHAMVLHRADTNTPQAVDLCALVRKEMTTLASANASEVEYSFDCPEEPVIVPGDAVTLREALKNVLNNALVYGARTRLNAHVKIVNSAAMIEISDDGPGIPEDQWHVVRKPFSPRSGGRGGASLGLAIVAEVVRAHHGNLEFSYGPQGDFLVTLTLPSISH